MSKTYISKSLRQKVAAKARHRCGYCLTSETITGMPLDVEHIRPEALGGPTIEENLWMACSVCNNFKGERINALDPVSGEVVALFNPRRHIWTEHFAWSSPGDEVMGLTSTGRATVIALQLNRELLVEARRIWVGAGLHPPTDY